jgi:peptide chain release factor 1
MAKGSMWDKLQAVEERFEEINRELSSPGVHDDPSRLQVLSKEHKDLSEVVAVHRSYRKAEDEHAGAKEMAASAEDPDMAEMAKEEVALLEAELETMAEQLKMLLIPKDPNDEKNAILEIRAGAGGDEAGIFAGDLFRSYTRYAEGRGWKIEVMSASEASSGGYKEVIAMITGSDVFSRLKFESGVHRVQRVPETESQGRIHTSTITVAVLPEAEEVEIDIQDSELRIDIYRSSGPGGQSVNTTDSAVRITHIPTGIVVAMQDEKSQIKNKAKAMRVLRARISDAKQAELDAERQANRRGQVGTGDRSEKIRTYNFPQSRVTDHRIGLTVHSLDQVMNGELDEVIEPLITHAQAEALQHAGMDD